MKLYIEIPHGRKLLVGATPNSGAILQALTEAALINEEGYGKDKKYIIENTYNIEVKVMPDDFMAELPDPIKTLQKEKEASDSRWIDYYNKFNTTTKKLEELQKDLDERGITYKKDGAKP